MIQNQTWKNNDLATCFPPIFPTCVLTRAQTQRRAAEIDLADSLLAQTLAADDLQTLTELKGNSKDATEKWKDLHLSVGLASHTWKPYCCSES